ncbi:MAG TPA: hypothetical protein VNA12_01345 [Mycobacteriales bacterium]|nr:hypothetical protein [Mycobacteriales bacterium]
MDADALLHPRGPLPPGVYWRRRAVTVSLVVLTLVLLARSCGDDGSGGATLRTGGATPAPSASPKPSAAPAPASPRASQAAPATSAARAPGQPCRDTDLQVMATANAKEFAAGSRPRLTLVVTNLAGVSCTRDLGAAARELRVISGSDRVWSSDDCAPGGPADVVLLEPGRTKSFGVTWSRTRSRPGCPPDRAPAAPGTYRVIGRLGTIERPGDVFSLRG